MAERASARPDAESSTVLVKSDDAALAFTERLAYELFTYDSSTSWAAFRSRLYLTAGISAGSPAAQDLAEHFPDRETWSHMAAVGQRNSFRLRSVYIPSLWRRTVTRYPELPNGAVGITVAGDQHVVWKGGSGRTPVAVTVLLLCPPAKDRCAINRVLTRAAR